MSLPITSVSNLAQECFTKFDDAMKRTKRLRPQDPLDSRLADFNLWVDNVGAMAKSGASLDSRFRARPDDLALVKTILSMLVDFLAEYVDILEEGRPITDALVNIDSCIRNLALIGVAIRRTGKASRSRRANQSFNPDEHHELRQHLECLVLLRPSEDLPRLDGLDISGVNEFIQSTPNEVSKPKYTLEAKLKQLAVSRMEQINPSRLDEIQKRLIEANLRRRHNFLLAQKRSQRFRKIGESNITAEKQQPSDIPHKFLEAGPMAHDLVQAATFKAPKLIGQRTKNEAPPTVAGYSTASTAEGTLQFNLARRRQPVPAVARSQISSIAANTEFPKPPSSSLHQLVFRCPCCCQSLPSEEFTSPNRWKQHLIEDLCPYTCIAQFCPTPDLLFTTRKAWELHVENDHLPQWQCLLCDGDDEPFSSKEDITTHIKTNHHEELSNYTLPSLISWAEVRYMGIRSCPLCPSHGPQDSPDLVDHAVRHAYEFALRALPWPKLAQENLDKPIGTYSLPEDVSAAKRLAKWLGEISPNSVKEVEASPYDKADHDYQENVDYVVKDDYFANNNYFEDQASADSSKRQTAQARSSTRWSGQSEEDFSSQNNQGESTQSETELMMAVRDGNAAAVQLLITSIDYESEVRQRALRCAVQEGHIEMVKQLLESGVDIDARDEHDQTVLFSAIDIGDLAMIQHLIESGADLKIKDENGQTALSYAMKEENQEIIRLINGGADISARSENGGGNDQTASFSAVEREAVTTLRRLLELGDSLYAKVRDGGKLLLLTERGNSVEGIPELRLTKEVYENFRNYYGQTSLSWALSNGKPKIAGSLYEWLRGTPLLAAQEIYNFEDHAAVVRNVKQGDDWFAVFNPLERVLDIELMDTLKYANGGGDIAFSYDGRYLAIGSYATTQIIDLETRGEVCVLDTPRSSLCFSPDGRSLATAGDGNLIYIWDIATKAVRHELPGHTERIQAICFSYDGNIIASGSLDGTTRIWDVEQGIEVQKLERDRYILSVAMSPDNHQVAAGGRRGKLCIWNLKTDALGKNVRELTGHNRDVNSVSFSSDSKYLVTGSDDRTVKMWDVGHGTCLKTLKGHFGCVYSVFMTPDDRWIISASEDGSVRLWDRTTGASPCVVQTHETTIDMALSPQGSYFATVSSPDILCIWSYGPYVAT